MTSLSSSTSPSAPALLMDDGIDSVSHVIVHPLVLLHVLDHHTRRQEVSGRVIGTLLGRRDGKTVRSVLSIDIIFCFCSFAHPILVSLL